MTGREVVGQRWAYWFGAVLDAVMVVPLVCPAVAGVMFGISGFSPGPDYLYAARVAAALMVGWTVLLLWGAREPVLRRGLLLITALPVVGGLALAGIGAVSDGLVAAPMMAPVWGVQAIALVVLLVGHRRAQQASRNDSPL